MRVPATSRFLGVYDISGTLEEGQVFIQYAPTSNGSATPIVGAVMVTRNPSVHPVRSLFVQTLHCDLFTQGDIRVLQAVNVPALRHLNDVIVFPVKGNGDPTPMTISGGDLDGDEYRASHSYHYPCVCSSFIVVSTFEPFLSIEPVACVIHILLLAR